MLASDRSEALSIARERIAKDTKNILEKVRWKGKPWLDWDSIKKIEVLLEVPYKNSQCFNDCNRTDCTRCPSITFKKTIYFGPKATIFDRLFSMLYKSRTDTIFWVRDYLVLISSS